jgi:hypothetical protein
VGANRAGCVCVQAAGRDAILFCCTVTEFFSHVCATAVGVFKDVDVYNSAIGAWSTAQLSVARFKLAAASVGNVAMFAGGLTSSALFGSSGGLNFT